MKHARLILLYLFAHQPLHAAPIQWREIVPPGALVFEIGGYVGVGIEKYRALGARVICLEPQQACIDILKKRYCNTKGVAIIGKVAADRAGSRQFYLNPTFRPVSTMSKEWTERSRYKTEFNFSWPHTLYVSAITLDQLIDYFGVPSFCMLDIEGSEYDALLGLSRKIPCLAFEFHAETFGNTLACIERLIDLGYSKFNITCGIDDEFCFDSWISAKECVATFEALLATYQLKNLPTCGLIFACAL